MNRIYFEFSNELKELIVTIPDLGLPVEEEQIVQYLITMAKPSISGIFTTTIGSMEDYGNKITMYCDIDNYEGLHETDCVFDNRIEGPVHFMLHPGKEQVILCVEY